MGNTAGWPPDLENEIPGDFQGVATLCKQSNKYIYHVKTREIQNKNKGNNEFAALPNHRSAMEEQGPPSGRDAALSRPKQPGVKQIIMKQKINKMFVSALHLLFFIKLRFPRGKYIKCYTQEMIKKYIYIFNAWLWIGFIRKFGCMI